ncbi:MAG: MBOAT family protein [Oscillospiraceae bacterium]|nr:MBOAT family protein [Oscillospiraceae bacterium]
MVFSSLLFMFIYLPVVLLVYYASPVRFRNIWLFIVNLVFYGWGEPVYILLMLFSITFNYFFGIAVGKYKGEQKKAKVLLKLCIVLNLLLLGFFKYYGLFASSINALGLITLPVLSLELPIGISFYTFQTMSYPIDVYRGDADVQKNYISFGTFVALFPQLIAGPIVRYKDIASQLGFRPTGAEQFSRGVERFAVGLGKKVLLANSIGALWDIYSASPASELTVVGSWMGILAFSLQIYFDFSGYSDMAIGLGKMLGFEFLENFNYPYISKSATEFWRRWHISLGSWFRDYVYIPLGGNRCSKGRQFFNIIVVWALTGFWHGASWTFLFWGLYYAVFLCLEKSFYLKALERSNVLGHIYGVLVAVCGWVLFDMPTLGSALGYYGAMFGIKASGFISAYDIFYLKSYALTLALSVFACLPIGKRLYSGLSENARAVLSPCLILIVLVFCTAYLVDASYNPFLYFRF